MKNYLIDTRTSLESINNNIFNELKSKGLVSETSTGFNDVRKHPTKNKYASCFRIGKVVKWDESIKKYVNESDLVELPKDWETQIT